MIRRALAAAGFAAAVLLTGGTAAAAEDDGPTTAPATSTPAVPTGPISLTDIIEALFGEGALDGCCGVQPTPQPSPGYVPPANTLTPPAPASSGFTPAAPRTYTPGPVAPGGGPGGPTQAPALPSLPTAPTEFVDNGTPVAATSTGCVPNAVRGSAGYSLLDDPDGDGVSCTPARPDGYVDAQPANGDQVLVTVPELLVIVASAVVLTAALTYRQRIRGRHRTRRNEA